jgi:hypothetical protein
MKSLTVVLVLLVTTLTLAQPPDTLWTRTYGGVRSDGAYSVQQTFDGGYIVAGYTYSFGSGNYDFYLVKTNNRGDILWTRTYGGSSDDAAYSAQQTFDCGYIMAGSTWSFGAGEEDFYLVKTDRLGDTLWTRTYGGRAYDIAYSIQQTADGGYIVAGHTNSFGSSPGDVYLVKTDSLGDTLWTHTYGGSGNDGAYSVQQSSDEGYIVAGYTNSFGAGGDDFYLVKTNSQGDTLWTRTYGGVRYDGASSVQQTTEGGYIIVGHNASIVEGYDYIYLVKTNSQGDTLWTRTFGGSEWDEAFSVQQTTDGGYIVAGVKLSLGAGDVDFYLVKTNNQGDTLWTSTYGGSGEDVASSVQQTIDGGYIVAGHTESFGAGNCDFYLVKLGAESSAEPISLSLPLHYSLHPNYPNPFNPSTRINYDLSTTSLVTLEVFDLLGRRVASLTNGIQSAGTYSILFNGSALPSGLYFYRLHAGTFTQTQKMVLIK